MYDLLIINGKVVDGTGNPWFKADIGIKKGKIARVSRISLKNGESVIDANNLIVHQDSLIFIAIQIPAYSFTRIAQVL